MDYGRLWINMMNIIFSSTTQNTINNRLKVNNKRLTSASSETHPIKSLALSIMNKEMKDVSWRECDIHKDIQKNKKNTKSTLLKEEEDQNEEIVNECNQEDYESEEEEEEEEDKDFMFQLFAQNNDFDIFDYQFTLPPSTTTNNNTNNDQQQLHLQLRGKEEIDNSTGLSMWLGSELLSQYIIQHPNKIQNKTIIELGAGMGLCGLVSYYLGADNVYVTDGDIHVMDNLRYNVHQNCHHNDKVDKMRNSSSNNCRISCPQLIWGQQMQEFQNKYGKANVILAADCIYMTQSVVPLWQTIDQLLLSSDEQQQDREPDQNELEEEEQQQQQQQQENESIVLYTNRSSSCPRAPLEMIFDTAAQYGFSYFTKTHLSFVTGAVGDDSVIEGDVYEFRRREIRGEGAGRGET